MTSSFRPGGAQMPSHYAPSQSQHVPSSSAGAYATSSPQYNTGSASSGTLKAWASQQDFLDVYMVNAFYFGTAQRSQYPMILWKTATCFGLQFVGILILMQEQWAAYTDLNQGGCTVGIDSKVALIAYFFATYITLYCSEQIRTLNRYGMYGWGEGQPEFVNSLWVGVGLWVNLFSLFLSWFVSCIIIFTSYDLLEMILNSVAVTFMLTLDDEIVGESDYNRIANWDGGNSTACRAINTLYSKIGGLLLKIHPCWQRRIQIRNCTFECCDFILCPFMIVIPFIVLFCFPGEDQLCLYEGVESLCVGVDATTTP